jgi:hypothetical protein
MANRRKWNDLSTGQKRVTILGGVLQMTLLVAALRDLRRRTPDELNGSKRLWTAAAFVNFVGPISYFLFGRKKT